MDGNALEQRVIRLNESIHSEKDTVKKHFHETYQILYAMEDEGEISLNGENYSFDRDQVAFITPYSNHSILAHTKLAVLVLEFEPIILDSTIHQKLIDEYFNQSKIIKVNEFDAMEIRQLLRKMLYQQSLGDSLDIVGMQVYLLQLLYLFARSQKYEVITNANTLRAEKLKEYIDSNYYNVMSSNDLSAKMGVSSRHVNTIFKDRYNKTPLQYLTEVRLELAKKLLVESNKDIISICFEVGFESLSTFYRTFSNYAHTSPKKYRSIHNHSYSAL
ncbi:AraC family transcriptional regulator [Virgibacillus sp. FSP13]